MKEGMVIAGAVMAGALMLAGIHLYRANTCCPVAHEEDSLAVSLRELSTRPSSYDDKLVRVRGHLTLEFENHTLSEEEGFVWVSPEPDHKFNGTYVEIVGRFDERRNGHLGIAPGTVSVQQIRTVEPVPHAGSGALASATVDDSDLEVFSCITYQGYASMSEYKHVASAGLPLSEQPHLMKLVRNAQFFNLPSHIAFPANLSAVMDSGSPAFVIKVQARDTVHTVTINTAVTEPSRELTPFLQWLERLPRVEGDGGNACRTLYSESLK